jgi:hypothetical protein
MINIRMSLVILLRGVKETVAGTLPAVSNRNNLTTFPQPLYFRNVME